jgi:hypothetical protein
MARQDVNAVNGSYTASLLVWTTLTAGGGNGGRLKNHNGRQKILFWNDSVGNSVIDILASRTPQGLALEPQQFTMAADTIWEVEDLEPSLYNSGDDLLIDVATNNVKICVLND